MIKLPSKVLLLCTILIIAGSSTNLLPMDATFETTDPDPDLIERGAISPLMQLKIWANAVATLKNDVAVTARLEHPSEEKIHELNTRKNALITGLTHMRQHYPDLFVGCPHIIASITRLGENRADLTPQQLGDILKNLGAIQGNLDPLIKDPSISPALKKAATILALTEGALVTLASVAYIIVRMFKE